MKPVDHKQPTKGARSPLDSTGGTTTPPDECADLEQIVSLAALSTQADSATLLRQEANQYHPVATHGCAQEATDSAIPLYHYVGAKDGLTVFSDLRRDPDWASVPCADEFPKFAGVPIQDDQRTLGILIIQGKQPGELTAQARQCLLHLSTLAASALKNGELESRLAATEAALAHSKEAYNKSEAFYHSLVESLPQNILRKDLEGRFTFGNQNFCQVLGQKLEDIIGKTDFDFFPSELAEKYQKDDRQVVESGKRFEATEENQTTDLEQSYVHVVKTPIYDRTGQIVGIQGIFWDVTEQRRVENDLAFERDLLRSLLDSIPDHVYFKDQSSRFIVCSKELSERLGLRSPEEAIGKTDFDFFDDAHAQPAFEDEQRIIKTGVPVIGKIEKEILRDGTKNWVLTSKMPFRSGNGDIIGTFGVSKDVTSLIETRQQLERAQKKYQDIFEQAVEGIFQTTPDGKYIEANPALARIYGYESARELLDQVTDIGKQLYVDHDRRREFLALMDRLGEVHEFESEIWRRDGSKIWIAETARIVKNKHGEIKYYEGIVEDISERKRAEAALQFARDAALESTRLKSIFLANMSHEIRTPMNGIIGMAGLLRRTELDEEQRNFAATIEESGLTLLRLINDILDFSKIESGKMTLEKAEFTPASVIEGVAELLAETAYKKGLEVIAWIAPDIPTQVVGDATRLRQVLNNLVGNAIKFTEAGEVEIFLSAAGDTNDSGELKIEVKDTGIGISQEAQNHIFEAFTQADESTTRRFGGTGLGLAISRQLIELMGGTLKVESVVDEGSNFWFTLPFDQCRAPSQIKAPNKHHFESAKVLIVDDNRRVCAHLQELLANEGFRCTLVNSSRRAKQLFEESVKSKAPFDYLIVDPGVSGNRGLKLCSVIRDLPGGRKIRKLLLSLAGKKAPSRRLAECDISTIIIKPVKRSQLLASLERARLGEKIGSNSSHGTGPSDTATIQKIKTNTPRVLVVEDNPVNQKVALHILKQLGYQGTAVNNGLEAIARLNQETFPIIFMDCQMPELDGYETTRRIREMEAKAASGGRAPSRIIAMTANAMEGDRKRCLDAGMDDYVSKPIMLPELESLLKEDAKTTQDSTPESTVSSPRLDPDVLANFNKLSPDDAFDPLADLAELFSEEIPRQTTALHKALDSGDTAAFTRTAHTFKGSANNIGARRLADLCSQLEHWESDLGESRDEIDNTISEIENEADAVIKNLQQIVAERAPSPKS